ncbi:MAG: signal peptidase II [Patescibacteria group bacterium]|nr:signal peptidase II [Patescibacteria group bacterium]
MTFLIQNKQQDSKYLIISLAVLFFDQFIKIASLRRIIEIETYSNYNSLIGLTSTQYVLFLFFFAIILYLKKNVIINSVGNNKIAFFLLITGIISNLFDMIFYGYIVDYITILNLLSFNIADVAICVGAFLLSWKVLQK